VNFFTGDDFLLSDSIEYVKEDVNGKSIVYVDNIYKYPDRVVEYLQNCPIISHKSGESGAANGTDFYDGRQAITEAYDQRWFEVHMKSCAMLGVHRTDWNGGCMFNMSRLNSSPKGHWYPHVDINCINGLVYLNKSNDYGPGTSFYKSFDYNGEGEHFNPWCDDADETHCILDRYNCAVFFNGDTYHSMRLVGDTFIDKTRFTEVHFLNY
tara:strand:- start:672 stop:1301 length:630 start_codon:yes stop_codon:yes gene_type:complete